MNQKHMVCALPVTPTGEVLLQQRDHAPGIAYPGAWTIFGGAVEADETPDEAIRRELIEELELEMPLRYWHTYVCPVRSIPGELDVLVHVYVGDLTRPIESLTLHEGQGMALVDEAKAKTMTLGFGKTPVLHRLFDEYLRGKNMTVRTIAGLDALRSMFAVSRAQGRAAFLPYYPIGYPDYEASLEAIRAMASAGVDGFEIGMPFSDPLADGPVIQAATQRALENGVTVRKCLEAVRTLRDQGVAQPMLMMGYLNPILAYGADRFIEDAKAAGADGVIIPDLPPEEAAELSAACDRHSMGLIFFLAPTSRPERIPLVAERTRGFIYVVSLTGVTGERNHLSAELETFIARVRAHSADVPLVMGFGISTPEHARRVSGLVDGFIVGSALVRAGAQGVEAVASLAHDLRAVLDLADDGKKAR
ncbi:MAG: tryptophan synthase subunit alpha [Anaerolineae bacterium]|nr:tryptophan synthase subunit alpha [Anaerolineae bacterium]